MCMYMLMDQTGLGHTHCPSVHPYIWLALITHMCIFVYSCVHTNTHTHTHTHTLLSTYLTFSSAALAKQECLYCPKALPRQQPATKPKHFFFSSLIFFSFFSFLLFSQASTVTTVAITMKQPQNTQGFFAIIAPANWILMKQNVLSCASGHSKY